MTTKTTTTNVDDVVVLQFVSRTKTAEIWMHKCISAPTTTLSWATTIWSSRLLHSNRDSEFLFSKTLSVLQPALAGISSVRRLNFHFCISMNSDSEKYWMFYLKLQQEYYKIKWQEKNFSYHSYVPENLSSILFYFRLRLLYFCNHARVYIGPLRFSTETVLLWYESLTVLQSK